MKKIYLDTAATTSLNKEVVKEMEKYFLNDYGNPSSQHLLGERALDAINIAREKLAKEINAKTWEIYFTSGGTESDNIAIRSRKNVLVSSIEHPAVISVAKVRTIPVDHKGFIDMKFLEKNVRNFDLVSVMHVNNIIGTIQDLETIGKICRKNNVLFHTDAVQSFGKLKIDVKKMNVDLLSASAHKIGGPKGIGFLYVRDGIKIDPIIVGGGQEKGLRSGTENVPGIMGFAKALEVYKKQDIRKIRKIQEYLINELGNLGKFNGTTENRIYNNVHFSFPVDAGTLVTYLSERGIYVSTGSACESKNKEDHVLRSISLSNKEIKGSIRISFDDSVKIDDARLVVREIKKAVTKLRI